MGWGPLVWVGSKLLNELSFQVPERPNSGGSIRMEASNPEASAKNGELVLCNINMDSSGGDF